MTIEETGCTPIRRQSSHTAYKYHARVTSTTTSVLHYQQSDKSTQLHKTWWQT